MGEAEDEEEEEEGECGGAALPPPPRCSRGGCQAVPHRLCTGTRGPSACCGPSSPSALPSRQRGVLHPALLDRRQRGHPASWLFRLFHYCIGNGFSREPGWGQLRTSPRCPQAPSKPPFSSASHDAYHCLHRLLYPLLLHSTATVYQDLCLDAAHLQ